MALLLPVFLLTASFATLQESADPAGEEQEVVVTGQSRSPHGRVEAPYSEVERVPLGSRIARHVARRPFRTVATNSGVAGLVGNTGSGGLNGAGGSGTNVRMRRITECVPDHPQVSEEIACLLFRVGESTAAGAYQDARSGLEPLLERRHLTDWEHYYIGFYAFMLAEADGDEAGRETALDRMIASGKMEEADRLQALRALAGMAIRNGDRETAISRLEQFADHGADPRSLANLAILHAQAGRMDQARLRMTQAVTRARQAGQTPAEEWTAFLARSN